MRSRGAPLLSRGFFQSVSAFVVWAKSLVVTENVALGDHRTSLFRVDVCGWLAVTALGELGESNGVVAVWTLTAWAGGVHESVAFVAALLAEGPGVADGALVDSHGPPPS